MCFELGVPLSAELVLARPRTWRIPKALRPYLPAHSCLCGTHHGHCEWKLAAGLSYDPAAGGGNFLNIFSSLREFLFVLAGVIAQSVAGAAHPGELLVLASPMSTGKLADRNLPTVVVDIPAPQREPQPPMFVVLSSVS